MKIKPELIIGLGNPSNEYEKTYHNVGFLAIDYLTGNLSIPLLKSDVFMNQSGIFVKKMLKKYKIKPENLMIIHDDADIELGKYKLSFARNSAGHRGVESIIDSLGTKNFWRLRIGIGQKTNGKRQAARIKAGQFVLKKITKADWEILKKTFSEIKI